MTETTERLVQALEKLPMIDKRIVERQPSEKMRQGKERLALLGADLAAVLTDLGGDVPVPPIGHTGKYLGGPIGVNNRRVVENKTFGSFNAEDYEGVDLVNCRFTKQVYGSCGHNTRFLESVFDMGKVPDPNGHGAKAIYFNNGHEEIEYNLIFDRCKFVGIEANGIFEFKLSKAYVANCEQIDCVVTQTIRQRHGRKLVCINNKGFSVISGRGWCHYIDNCPGATVTLWNGNLPYAYADWGPLHIKLGGFNMQGSRFVYANGVGKVITKTSGDGKYPALDCIIGPNVVQVNVPGAKNLTRETLASYKDLWARAGVS